MSKSLAEIVEVTGELAVFKNVDDFKLVVNKNPTSLAEDHPYAKGVKFIPIAKIETLLDMIFQQWRVEILDSGQLLNSVFVNVRLHYKHPITGELEFHDGTGAVAIQTDSGKPPTDLAAIKSNAVMLALPAAKSYAIKDAAEHIGKLFGRDLNRKDTMAFTPSYSLADKKKELKEKIDESN